MPYAEVFPSRSTGTACSDVSCGRCTNWIAIGCSTNVRLPWNKELCHYSAQCCHTSGDLCRHRSRAHFIHHVNYFPPSLRYERLMIVTSQ